MKPQIVGMAWFKRAHYSALRAMFKDGHKLHRTYDEWLAAAERGEQRLRADGIRVVRVDIDPDDFPIWCKAQGLKLDAEARIAIANLRAVRILRGDS